jgi:hypothetical protein
MINGTTKLAKKIRPRLANQFCLGYSDFKIGLSYYDNTAYETWPEPDQKNYERGRLWAAEGKQLRSDVMSKVSSNVKLNLAISSIEL